MLVGLVLGLVFVLYEDHGVYQKDPFSGFVVLGFVAACLVVLLGAQVRLLDDGVEGWLVDLALDLVAVLVLWPYVAVAVPLDIDVVLPQ